PSAGALSFCLATASALVYCRYNTARLLGGIMRTSILAAVVAASTATSACGQAHSENGGPTVSRNYQVGGFDQIEVAGPYDVSVRTGSGPTVAARGPEKMLEHMVVEVRNGKLVVHPERSHSWFNTGWHFRGKVELTVTVPQ